MSGLINNFNSFVDTKEYSSNIKQQIKEALSDKKLSGEEIAKLKKSFNNDAAFESALKDIITSKGVEEVKKHENNPSDFEFSFAELADKKAEVILKSIELNNEDVPDDYCGENCEDDNYEIQHNAIGEINLAIPDTTTKTDVQSSEQEVPQTTLPQDTSINNEEYNSINDSIKTSKSNTANEDGVKFHSNAHKKTGETSPTNYVTLKPEKLPEVKSFQGFIGTDTDGFIGPKTLGALMKKYDALQAKGDSKGLEDLIKYVDDLGLKNVFKGKILGKSLDELTSKTKLSTPENKEVKQPVAPSPQSTPETREKQIVNAMKEVESVANKTPLDINQAKGMLEKIDGLKLDENEKIGFLKDQSLMTNLNKIKDTLSNDLSVMKSGGKAVEQTVKTYENTINSLETIIDDAPVVRAAQASQPGSSSSVGVDKCLQDLAISLAMSSPSGISKVITEEVMKLQPQEFKEFVMKIIASNKEKTNFVDLANKISSAYDKANNYDKRVFDMAISLIQEQAQNMNDFVSKDPNVNKDKENIKQNIANMNEFVGILKNSPSINNKNGANPSGFDKDKMLSSIRSILADKGDIAQRREKLISNVPILLNLDDKTYSTIMDNLRQNPNELQIILKQLDELKQGANQSDLFELRFIQKKLAENIQKK